MLIYSIYGFITKEFIHLQLDVKYEKSARKTSIIIVTMAHQLRNNLLTKLIAAEIYTKLVLF